MTPQQLKELHAASSSLNPEVLARKLAEVEQAISDTKMEIKALEIENENLRMSHPALNRKSEDGDNWTAALHPQATTKEIMCELDESLKKLREGVRGNLDRLEEHFRAFRQAVQEEWEGLDEDDRSQPGWKEIGEDIQKAT